MYSNLMLSGQRRNKMEILTENGPGRLLCCSFVYVSSAKKAKQAIELMGRWEMIDVCDALKLLLTVRLNTHQRIRVTVTYGVGVVCSAYDTHLVEKVTRKKINDIFEHVSDAARILREIKLLRLLRHHDIVEIKHILLPPSRRDFRDIYVVLEFDLHQVIKANDDLTPEHYQFFLYQLLRGLKYIYTANAYHRDLKPKSILANADYKLKICDLGLARVAFNNTPTVIFWIANALRERFDDSKNVGKGDMQIILGLRLVVILWPSYGIGSVTSHGDQRFSKISIHEAVFALDGAAYVKPSPLVLGLKENVNHNWYFLTMVSTKNLTLTQGPTMLHSGRIKKNCMKFGAGEDLYTFFTSILTIKQWERVIDPAVDHLAITDQSKLQIYGPEYFSQVTELLHRLPRVILLMIKTNDCLRSVNNALLQRPSLESFLIIGRVSSKAVIEEKLLHAKTLYSLISVWFEEISLEVRFILMRIALWALQFKKSLSL